MKPLIGKTFSKGMHYLPEVSSVPLLFHSLLHPSAPNPHHAPTFGQSQVSMVAYALL